MSKIEIFLWFLIVLTSLRVLIRLVLLGCHDYPRVTQQTSGDDAAYIVCELVFLWVLVWLLLQ